MLSVSQIKLPVSHNEEDLLSSLCRALKTNKKSILSYQVVKQSLDARKNQPLLYVYTLEAEVENEKNIVRTCRNTNVTFADQIRYSYKVSGEKILKNPPVIVGSGPAGLFCAYFLALEGYRPCIIERGDCIEDRTRAVDNFWSSNELDPESNAQFGEGGAGTYSDGKLNTMVKDKTGRIRKVLDTFVGFGAPNEILYRNKPHIGTDKLRNVIINMRKEIILLGGSIRFRTKLTDIIQQDNQLQEIEVNNHEIIPCELLILAIGHSARDTFELLQKRGVAMEPKPFAVGLRVEHPQKMIDQAQYHLDFDESECNLPAADYKLTHQTKDRGVYSFCMCPGGFVVNASSEPGLLTVNGMSNHARDEKNANSAIVVTVTAEDFIKTSEREDFADVLINAGVSPDYQNSKDLREELASSPLLGIAFQRYWERKTFLSGKGRIPAQLYGDLINHVISDTIGEITPNTKGNYTLANLHDCLPEEILNAIIEGMNAFGRSIHGFDRSDTIMLGIEARTSSPVRITRDDNYYSNITGIIPCGEGAGYAGGIVSAAVDGIRAFESIAGSCKPLSLK